MYITDLNLLSEIGLEKEKEHEAFSIFLKEKEDVAIDNLVHQINIKASAAIDCTACGNCCKNLVIAVDEHEIDTLSVQLKEERETFIDKYIETSLQGVRYINTHPCHFLKDNKCTVYQHRFTDCRDFPHLHKPGFIKRLQGTLMHYSTCPIVFNVMEELKQELNFNKEFI